MQQTDKQQSATTPFDASRHINTLVDAGHYLEAAMEGGDESHLRSAVRDVIRAALANIAPEPVDGLVDLLTDQVVRDILSAKDVAAGRERMKRAIRAALTIKETPDEMA